MPEAKGQPGLAQPFNLDIGQYLLWKNVRIFKFR